MSSPDLRLLAREVVESRRAESKRSKLCRELGRPRDLTPYVVDRARYRGVAGEQVAARLPALVGADAARRDRCDETVLRARATGPSRYRVVQLIGSLPAPIRRFIR